MSKVHVEPMVISLPIVDTDRETQLIGAIAELLEHPQFVALDERAKARCLAHMFNRTDDKIVDF